MSDPYRRRGPTATIPRRSATATCDLGRSSRSHLDGSVARQRAETRVRRARVSSASAVRPSEPPGPCERLTRATQAVVESSGLLGGTGEWTVRVKRVIDRIVPPRRAHETLIGTRRLERDRTRDSTAELRTIDQLRSRRRTRGNRESVCEERGHIHEERHEVRRTTRRQVGRRSAGGPSAWLLAAGVHELDDVFDVGLLDGEVPEVGAARDRRRPPPRR